MRKLVLSMQHRLYSYQNERSRALRRLLSSSPMSIFTGECSTIDNISGLQKRLMDFILQNCLISRPTHYHHPTNPPLTVSCPISKDSDGFFTDADVEGLNIVLHVGRLFITLNHSTCWRLGAELLQSRRSCVDWFMDCWADSLGGLQGSTSTMFRTNSAS